MGFGFSLVFFRSLVVFASFFSFQLVEDSKTKCNKLTQALY